MRKILPEVKDEAEVFSQEVINKGLNLLIVFWRVVESASSLINTFPD